MEAFRPRRHDLLDPFDLRGLPGRAPGRAHPPRWRRLRRRPTGPQHACTTGGPPSSSRRPAPGDVARTVVLARDAGMALAVRSGGHSVAGHSTVDGGIVLDLCGMKGLHIDAERRTAWAQPGLTAGEYTAAAAAHGLATPFGDTGSVGIAGLTLGGGHRLSRAQVRPGDRRAAGRRDRDGRRSAASRPTTTDHPDLFWAVRGGGGNFGVVTRFQFQLYPVETVLGGALFLPPTADVLRSLVSIAADAPEELTTISFLMPIPPVPFVPAERHGELVTHRDVRVGAATPPMATPPSSPSGRSRRRSPKRSCRCRTRASTSSPRAVGARSSASVRSRFIGR